MNTLHSLKILYICSHNRCRSILSEAITREASNGVIEAKSAGSQAVQAVHPLTLKYLIEAGYATDDLKSQSWHELESFEPDLVITVCDSAAGEACPAYFSKSLKLHWGLSDPSKVDGNEQHKAQAFADCMAEIHRRVEQLIPIASENLNHAALKQALISLGAQA